MATPNTATADDETPWDLTQTDAPAAAPPSPPPSAAPSSSAADTPIDYGAIAKQLLQQPTLPQPDTTPVTRGLLSRIGEALGGGQVSGVMSPAQQEMAGLRSLRDFGTSLIAGSGYYPGKPALGAFAEGFQGAERSQRGSEQQAAATLAAQQQYAAGQQQQYLERLKTALPLLQMQRASGQPNLLAGGPAVPGTSAGAGTPGGGGVAPLLTPFVAKNLPAGVTPAEDQMVRTVIGEAGGEPLTGQQGVAAVIKNRMAAGKQDAQSVIFTPNQFEPWNNPATRAKLEAIDPGSQVYQDVLNKAVRPVMSGDAQDPTGGATNFYSPTAQKALGRDTPSWAAGQTPSTTIGGHQFYKLPYGPGTLFAGPGAPTGGAAAAPVAPAATSQAPAGTAPAASTAPAATQPDTRPDSALTWEEFQARHATTPITAETQPNLAVTPDPASLQQAQSAMDQARQDLSFALTPEDKTKAQQAYATASNNVATLKQEAAKATAANLIAAQKNQTDVLAQNYRAAKAAQAAADLEKQKGEQAIAQAKVTAGYTQQQHQIDAEQQTGAKQLEAMGTQAQKAAAIQPMLRELVPLLKNAPSGAIGQILQAHQDWIPALTAAHIVPANVATTAQLVQGLTDYLALDLKPTATGALRNTEIPMLKGMGPQLGQSTQAQQQALARILNYTQRVKDEYDVATENFGAVDEKTSQPNYKILYRNLDAPMQLDDNGQRVGGGLGPVVPEPPPMVANPTPQQKVTAMRYQKYVANLPSGMPYNTYERQADGSYQRVLKIQP